MLLAQVFTHEHIYFTSIYYAPPVYQALCEAYSMGKKPGGAQAAGQISVNVYCRPRLINTHQELTEGRIQIGFPEEVYKTGLVGGNGCREDKAQDHRQEKRSKR